MKGRSASVPVSPTSSIQLQRGGAVEQWVAAYHSAPEGPKVAPREVRSAVRQALVR